MGESLFKHGCYGSGASGLSGPVPSNAPFKSRQAVPALPAVAFQTRGPSGPQPGWSRNPSHSPGDVVSF